ncbi:Fic family protein [Flavobacterium sp.]|uniref:Fic family protein n=1 Tax=Flavobacterium sp. TaxID=239 RepID=UPI00374D84E9
MENILKALALKSELDTLRPIDKEQEDRIMQKFRLDWNYHSNHLEGNSLTYGETKALILFGITAQGKPLKDTLEITGHNEAINWVLEMVTGDRPLTENFIRELHSLLLKDSYKESKNADGVLVPRKISAGKYKTTSNHVETVTGEIFYFATPEETPSKMTDLIDWYKSKTEQNDVNPVLLAAEFYYKFIRIHPFDDGNGRTARILMNFILMKFNYPPVIIKTEDKANYFAVLQLADAGNLEAFTEYIAQNLVRSLEIMITGANGESIEEDDDLDKEIALLEQKVKSLGEKIEITKSKDAIINIYDDSLKRLYEKFKESCQKFEKFYIENKCYVLFDDGLYKNDLLNQRNSINEKTKSLAFVSHHNIFKIENYGEFNYRFSSITITFNLDKYNLRCNDIKFYEKSYLEQLTEEEINKIINTISKKHISFIEQKIAEKK